MQHRNKRRISGEVFSAKTFFEQCASGVAHPNGKLSFTEEIPERGVGRAAIGAGSLIWVDGIYADSIAQERFFSSLLSGEVPPPIYGTLSRAVNQRTTLTSPGALVTFPQTILGACGLVDIVASAALNNPHTRCAICNSLLNRYHSPLSLLDALARDQDGKTVSIRAESNDVRLVEWATSRGLRIESDSRGYPSVYLAHSDAGVAIEASIGSLVHSLWRIPNVRLTTCESTPHKPARRYAPPGWCERCDTIASKVSPKKLREILAYGLGESSGKEPEALLALTPTLTVREILLSPIHTLLPVIDSPLHKAYELLMALTLGACSFGDTTDTLDARDLAKVSIVASVLESIRRISRIIIDLPSRIIERDDVATVQGLLEGYEAVTSATIVHDIFSTNTLSSQETEIRKGTGPQLLTIAICQPSAKTSFTHEIRTGSLLRIVKTNYYSHKLFRELTEQITTSATTTSIPMIIAPIPVFSSYNQSVSVIGEELGLLGPLAQLYAASLDARVHGLTPKDFTLFRTRSPRYGCKHCGGLGTVFTYYEALPRPLAAPCTVCCGARCKPPVGTALFRGVSFSTILNQPISQSAQILSALSKAKAILDMVVTLELHHLSLGMPVALLSASELRRLFVVCALRQARRSNPAVILFEAPTVGLSDAHQERLARIRDASLAEESAAWIELL